MRMGRVFVGTVMLGTLLTLLIGCGSTSSATATGASASTVATAGGQAAGSTSAAGSAAASTLTLGAQTYNNHGMASVQGMETVALTVDTFFFSPTFLQGAPGQKVTLQITNASGTMHNITMQSTPPIDTDIPAHGKVTVDATIPQSGVMLFYCEYHTGQGMNGQMLAAPATPQPASQDNAQPTKDPYYG